MNVKKMNLNVIKKTGTLWVIGCMLMGCSTSNVTTDPKNEATNCSIGDPHFFRQCNSVATGFTDGKVSLDVCKDLYDNNTNFSNIYMSAYAPIVVNQDLTFRVDMSAIDLANGKNYYLLIFSSHDFNEAEKKEVKSVRITNMCNYEIASLSSDTTDYKQYKKGDITCVGFYRVLLYLESLTLTNNFYKITAAIYEKDEDGKIVNINSPLGYYKFFITNNYKPSETLLNTYNERDLNLVYYDSSFLDTAGFLKTLKSVFLNSRITPTSNPGSKVPSFIIDSDGYGVLLWTKGNIIVSPSDRSVFFNEMYESFINFFEFFHNDKIVNKDDITNYSTYFKTGYKSNTYYNDIAVTRIKGFRIYDYDLVTKSITLMPSSDLILKFGIDLYSLWNLQGSKGITYSYLNSVCNTPICFIFDRTIEYEYNLIFGVGDKFTLKDFTNSVVIHEIAHGWFPYGVTNPNAGSDNHTFYLDGTSNSGYYGGFNSRFSIMRSDPKGTDDFKTFFSRRLNFDAGTSERLSRILSVTPNRNYR